MSRRSDESRWQEDYARERRVSTVVQSCNRAVVASLQGRIDEADERLADARHHWSAGDEIGDLLLEADYARTGGAGFRHALREAGQLLDRRADFAVRFDSGGEVA